MAGRVFKTPPLRINTAEFLADTTCMSNEEFGRMFRKMVSDWRQAKGRWVRRGSLSEVLRRQAFARDGRECQYCGADRFQLEIDHIVPVKAGGTDDLANLCVACILCNRAKSDKSLEEFLDMQWFRLHTKILHDPRVQTMSSDHYKLYINLLCLACERDENGAVGNVSDVSFVLRETQEAVSSAFHDFKTRGLIETDGETFHIPQWKKKQFKSDSSTGRVRKFRNKTKRAGNVTVTAPETEQSRAESEEKEEPNGPSFSKEKIKKTKKKSSSAATPQETMTLVFPEDEEARRRAEHLVAICTKPSCASFFQPFPRKAANGKWQVFAGSDWREDRIDSQFHGRLDAAYGENQWEFAREAA